RLTGGPSTPGCIGNAEQMGEGWSDFFGLMLTMRATDTRTTNRGVGTYALFQPTTGPGIRPAPYNTNFAVNDYTYQDSRTQAIPHGVGFIWNTILWEATWDMIDQYGFSAAIYNGTGTAGNQMMLRIVTEGLKLQPCEPGFVDGRNAILQADANLYPDAANPGRGLHYSLLWSAFARRGLGFSATQGSVTSNADNTESFDTPLPAPTTATVSPASVLAVAPPNGTTTATVTLTNPTANSSALTFTTVIENATIPAFAPPLPLTREAVLPSADASAQSPSPWLEAVPEAPAFPAAAAAPEAAASAAPSRGAATGASGNEAAVAVSCTGGQVLAQNARTSYSIATSGTFEFGQSFTAPCTGYLTTVSPQLYFQDVVEVHGVAVTGTMRVYAGAGTAGAVLGSGPVAFTNLSAGEATLNVPLTTQALLTEGQVYTWFLDLTSGKTPMLFSTANPYSGGTYYVTGNGNPASAGPDAARDMQFSLAFAPPVNWIRVSTSGGTVPGGASRAITLSFDATGLAAGTYTAELKVTTNTSGTPTVTVPVTFLVRNSSVQVAGQGGWRMMAAPTSTMTVANLASQNLVQGIPGYYATDPRCGGVCQPNLYTGYTGSAYTAPAGGSDVLQPGRGMLWYFYNQNITPGGPSNSVALPMTINAPAGAAEPTASVPVTLHAAGNKWNMLGNPFMTGINVSDLPSWASGGTLTSAVGQVWD
ncbi:MAG TPA: M36 family metallopeptidase, partial [Rhodothermales bacterium]|nr:M36 family metallopeptidase [Rhodothermales bacterium]